MAQPESRRLVQRIQASRDGIPEGQLRRLLGAALLLALAAVCCTAAPGAAPVQSASFRSFHTPSGNIGCYADGGYLRCDIAQKTWRGPPKPRSCPLAYGDSLTMQGTGRPVWTCHGDTALGSGRALPYGATWRAGPFTCTSRFNGLTCRNRAGHGFFLSRQSYRTF